MPVLRRVQRQSDIKRDTFALGLHFDAGAADLTGAAMDANPHALPRMSCQIFALKRGGNTFEQRGDMSCI